MPFGRGKALLEVEWINGERVAGLGTRNEVVEVAVRVPCPDLFDEQLYSPAA